MRSLRVLLSLPLLCILGCDATVVEIGLPLAGGGLPVRVGVLEGVDPADVRIALDGRDVRSFFTPSGNALRGVLPLPAPGGHEIEVEQPWLISSYENVVRTTRRSFEAPAATPALARFVPAPIAGAIAHTAWLQLEFTDDVPADALTGFGFGIECSGNAVSRVVHHVERRSVVLDPTPVLPAGACRVAWRGPAGIEERTFQVAAEAATSPASPLYQPSAPQTLAPFPDDLWLVDDPTTATGRRIVLVVPPFGDGRDPVVQGIAASMSDLDGWSPVGPIVLTFSHAVERSLLPLDETTSLGPLVPIRLFDADPDSPDYGKRVRCSIEARDDLAPDGSTEHALLVYPSITLRTSGRYALIVTRHLIAAGDPTRPFGPSPFFARVMADPSAADDAATVHVRALAEPLLDVVAEAPALPVRREDIALAVSISTRSSLRDPSDLVAIKEDALVAPPPALTVESVTSSADRALVVRGKLALPEYLDPVALGQIVRDPVSGRPLAYRNEPVPFLMTLPAQAASGPVPIVIYQHGSPGSPEEILGNSQEFLDDEGYALVGIQDTSNRRFGEDVGAITAAILINVVLRGRLPLTDFQTHANLISFLRALTAIAAMDWLPAGAPDGRPELDASKLLYRGISFGAHHSLGFLPFAPEITAAVSVVGSGRNFETTLHQIDFFDQLSGIQAFIPTVRPSDYFVGVAALQNDQDRQDSHLLARFLYRERLAIAGIAPSAAPASLLWIEGIGDSLVPNNATRAAARELGIPQVGHARRVSQVLEQVPAPLAGNFGDTRTAGHYQYEPSSTPSCVGFGQFEGHFCPQIATEAETQILRFFATALSGAAPEIIDPLP